MAQMPPDKGDPFSSRDECPSRQRLADVDLGIGPRRGLDRPRLRADRSRASPRCSRRASARSAPSSARCSAARRTSANVHDDLRDAARRVFRGRAPRAAGQTREELGRNVIDNTERGLKHSLGDVRLRQCRAEQIYTRFLEFFQDVDVLICPAASVSPFPHAQLFIDAMNGEQMPTYMRWLAITYAPTMALPCAAVHTVRCGSPRHAVRHPGDRPERPDAKVLEVARALERVMARNKETARPIPPLPVLTSMRSMASP